ncbi:MAG: ExbD/TolR family protein [Kiritimatiellia bacterium]
MATNRKSRNKGEAAKLEMTPMIDVVFQLLIFFIVTLKEQDILSNLNVSRPAPDSRPPPDTRVELLTVEIGRTGWVVNGAPFMGDAGFVQLERALSRLASISRDTSVIVKCTADSHHGNLIQILNVLSRLGMQNISVFSL